MSLETPAFPGSSSVESGPKAASNGRKLGAAEHVDPEAEPLAQQLSALEQTYATTILALEKATRHMRAAGPPAPYQLIETLGSCHRQFLHLRNDTLAKARTLGYTVPAPDQLLGLRELIRVVEGMERSAVPVGEPSASEPAGLPPTETPVPSAELAPILPVLVDPEPELEPAVVPEPILHTPEPVIDEPAAVTPWPTEPEPEPRHGPVVPPPGSDVRAASLKVLAKAMRLGAQGGAELPGLDAVLEQSGSLYQSILTNQSTADVPEAVALASGEHPIAQLLTIVEGNQQLNDAQWADLHASVSNAFGRPLAIAAARSRLMIKP